MKRLFAISVLGAPVSGLLAVLTLQLSVVLPLMFSATFAVCVVGCWISSIAIFVRGWRADRQPTVRAVKGEKSSSGGGITAHSLLWCALATELMVAGAFTALIIMR